jgi:transposase
MRLSRSGNRQLNTALHRIAITQIRLDDTAGQVYYRDHGTARFDVLSHCERRRRASAPGVGTREANTPVLS